jgi:hypothetical protein
MANEYRVGDEYRKNELSLQPGGDSIHVIYSNGTKKTYDKIKTVDRYVERITKDQNVVEVWHESSRLIWKRDETL